MSVEAAAHDRAKYLLTIKRNERSQSAKCAQNAVLERLVPALDLALGLRMAWGAANMRDATVL